MDDKHLLEMAAKAVGYCKFDNHAKQMIESGWNPLTNDADAFRLMVALGLGISVGYEADPEVYVCKGADSSLDIVAPFNNDKNAATRRAIVRYAAEIGEGL